VISLLKQSWSPKTNKYAVTWVQPFFDAWEKTLRRFETFDFPILDQLADDIAQPDDKRKEVTQVKTSGNGLVNHDKKQTLPDRTAYQNFVLKQTRSSDKALHRS